MKAAIDSLFTLVLLISVPLTANAELGTRAEDVAEVATKIGIAEAQLVLAMERRDSETICSFYSEDAVLLPPNDGFIRGRKSIYEFWKKALAGTARRVRIRQVSIDLVGDTVFETGTIDVQGTALANYIVTWKHQATGAWEMNRHIWNAAQAAE